MKKIAVDFLYAVQQPMFHYSMHGKVDRKVEIWKNFVQLKFIDDVRNSDFRKP